MLFVALFASYPFSFLAIAAILYLAHIPFAWRMRLRMEEREQAAATAASRAGKETKD